MKWSLIKELRENGIIRNAMDKNWDIPPLDDALEGTRDTLVCGDIADTRAVLHGVIDRLSGRDLDYLVNWMFTAHHIEDHEALFPALAGFYKAMAEIFLGEEVDEEVRELLRDAQDLYDGIYRYQNIPQEEIAKQDLAAIIDRIEGLIERGMKVEANEEMVLCIIKPDDEEEE